jgi:hypothetical protein
LKRCHDKSTHEVYSDNPSKVEENGKTIGNDTLENKVHVISNVKDHKQTSKMCGIKI